MLVTHVPSLGSKAERNLYHTIISLRTRVNVYHLGILKGRNLHFKSGEKARICAAGGFVDFGRVNGNLALSRAIGDFEFKKSAELSPEQQIVTAFPDVIAHTITDDDEFLVIACDGTQTDSHILKYARPLTATLQEYGTASHRKLLLSSSDAVLQPNRSFPRLAKT